MKKVNLGLIGLGQMGKVHFHNCLHLKNARLIAVCDVSKKSLLTAKKAGVKNVFKDYNDLLKDPNIDAVIISLPTFLHAETAIEATENGKAVLVEKPLARDTSEGERILLSAKRNGVKLMVGYPLQFSPSFVKLKNQLKLGTLGNVQIAAANHISTGPFFARGEKSVPKPVPSWWFDTKLTGGGALIDLGCHMINLLRWYFGGAVGIQCHLGHRFNMDFEDHATCILRFNNGTIATLNVGWFARYHKVQVDVYGTVGHASAASKSPGLFDYAKRILRINTSSPFYKELECFVNCISSDTQPSPSGEEGLEDLKLISTAYKHALHENNTLGDNQ
jgi:myo-inositol 2-dehydrogenase/D-chiro-inositol 1-dehydrogenase